MPKLPQEEFDDLTKRLEALQRSFPGLGSGSFEQPLRLEDLVGRYIPSPIPIGGTAQQGFAPRGPNLTFTGGLTHQPNHAGAVLNNALNFFFTLRKDLEALKKKAKEQQLKRPTRATR